MTPLYSNPVLAGFHPDPSICRVNDDYYLVCSSFAYWPGIPVFHSRDLVNWELINHVITRVSQIDLNGFCVSKGIFAPTIRHHKNIFYLSCTVVDGKGNFIATTKDPSAAWSELTWLPEINGIDPSVFFDDDGAAYVCYNSIAPGDRPLYNGHRTIRMRRFNIEKISVEGEELILVNGGCDLSKNPRWIESPHVFKRSGYYYLLAAEGGTGADHSVVVFRADKISGPWIAHEKNPILKYNRKQKGKINPVTSTGHADFVELQNGTWEAVFLGCRPYEDDFYNTGRETFLAPVTWHQDWPVINDGFSEVQDHYPYPLPVDLNAHYKRNNFSYQDDFDREQLNPDWMFLRTPKKKWYSLTERKNFLALFLQPETCIGQTNPCFLALRQPSAECTITTSIIFNATAENEKAGLLVFQNEDHFYFLCVSTKNKKKQLALFQSILIPADGIRMELIKEMEIEVAGNSHVFLKIEAQKDHYNFYFSDDNRQWQLVKDRMDARFLSTRTAGGFVGCVFALYATSSGLTSNSIAWYDWVKLGPNCRF